jgi:hypothetical protein
MHFRTHVKAEHAGISGQDEYTDGMVEHDMHVGELLKLIDELGIADNTIVQYSTDNGPHYNTWPDAGTTPFRSEKNSNWEGALPRALPSSLARPLPGGRHAQRHRLARRLATDLRRRRRSSRHEREAARALNSTAASTRTTSTATTSSTTSAARPRSPRARSSGT